jgi:hypothetical protein
MEFLEGRRRARANPETRRRGYAFSLTLVAFGLAMTAGCGAESDAPVLEPWTADPHFQVIGTIDGEDLDVLLDQPDELVGGACVREYEVPRVDGVPQYDQGRLVEIKVNVSITLGDVTRLVELELKRHDFQSDAIGAEAEIVPRVGGIDPAADAMWLEWEWHDLDDTTLFESAAQTGTASLELYTGEPDANGLLIPDGQGEVGFVISARWSASEHLDISLTVPCGPNKIDYVDAT